MAVVNPILVTSTRSDLKDVQHRGAISVVDANGQEVLAWGDTNEYVYPRSALKLFQVLPLIESGAMEHFHFAPAEIALMCASHNSESAHVATAQSILDKAGVETNCLKCGVHHPMSQDAFREIISAGDSVSPMHNNCSGKHAGFLALAKFLGADLDSYLDLEHEVQRRIRARVAAICDLPVDDLHFGIDGCTAPNYAMPLHKLAHGMARLCQQTGDNPWEPAAKIMMRAMQQHSFMVGGSSRFCTELLSRSQGKFVGKLGAAGVYVLGCSSLSPTLGVAIKIDDGATGPQYNVALRIMQALGLLPDPSDGLQRFQETPILNCRAQTIGYQACTPELTTQLQAWAENIRR